MASKFLGQHFLKSGSAIQRIITAIAPERGDVIIEIGPGHGELTIPLQERCKELGGQIIAIEKDAALAEQLSTSSALKQVEFMKGDVLELLPALTEKKYKLVGNIPYYVTGHLLRTISELPHKPGRSVFMVQKEVAERVTEHPPRMNRLAASVQFWATPKIAGIVPKEDFDPKPKVDSAILILDLKIPPPPLDASRYYAAIRALFAQPRKTILNNIAGAKKEGSAKEQISQALLAIGIIPEARPQDLGIEDILRMAESLF